MKNFTQILSSLAKLGFIICNKNKGCIKIYPMDKNKPFYSCHPSEKSIHPIRRFAKKHWNIDLEKL